LELEQNVRERCRLRGLNLETLSDHTLSGYNGERGLLVGFGSTSEASIPLVVEEIAEAFADNADPDRPDSQSGSRHLSKPALSRTR
jgi:hypothetical protein